MIRFVDTDAEGLPQKRNQSLRACDDCRKRKKRCMHNASTESSVDARPVRSPTNATASGPRHQPVTSRNAGSPMGSGTVALSTRANDANNSSSDSESGDRFVGDLNPESIFLAATSPQTQSSGDNVGIWVPRKSLLGLRKRMDGNSDPSSPGSDTLLYSVLLPYVQQQCQQSLPPPSSYTVLHSIYVQEVHPIFPVIDLESLDISRNSPSTVMLKQSICLAAAASPRAVGHYQLPTSQGGLVATDVSTFSRQLTSAIRSSIDLGFVKDRISIVQALTIVGLFTQFSDQADRSAEITARAISHAQTIGLHLELADVRKNHAYLTRLFCCIWALDKLNAAFQGRPTILHDHDFDRDWKQATAQQESCFRLLLSIISRLDQIIALYRPGSSSTTASSVTPVSFESQIQQCDALRVPPVLLGTLELLHNAVTILSCRSKVSSSDGFTIDSRETLSAMSVISIIGSEFQDQVTYLPFAPYAMSLSLRVFYRELRFGTTSTFTRNRVRKQLLNACDLLRKYYSASFPSAMKVADLAEQTVTEMDKVYSSIRQRYHGSRAHSEAVNQGDEQRATEAVQVETHENGPAPDLNMGDFDASSFEGLQDLNVFEYFDPDFHLDAVDAALADNMGLTLPPILGGIDPFGEAVNIEV